ncbi:MAG: hypothetical protein JXN60_01355 [Lentisphaerae bacterium]|nr:hypothetical protein [Lentisphaerota bacterium]
MATELKQESSTIFTNMGETIRVFVPIKWKRTGGRKQIILPDGLPSEENKPTPLQIALSRAYVWQKWIDEGEYANAKELSQDLGLDPALVRRILRLGLLCPRIVESSVASKDSEVLLQTLLDMEMPVLWEEQEVKLAIN